MADTVLHSTTGGDVEHFASGKITYTVKSGQTVTGGQLVELTASREVQKAGAGSLKCVGKAMHDAAAGEKVTVWNVGAHKLTAAGSISAGDQVICAANGTVTAFTLDVTGTPSETTIEASFTQVRGIVGIALEDISNTATGDVLLRLGG